MTSALKHKRKDPNGSYTFTTLTLEAAPIHLSDRGPAKTENEGRPIYGNIMYDRRVVRGKALTQCTLPVTSQPDPLEIQKQQNAVRHAVARERAKEGKSPGILDNRKHAGIQTELYLEELSDHIETTNVTCQSDAFLDTPDTPLFIPAKSGKDAATQIEEGELFDFDREVQPVLEVLVGKTIEQALLEVLQEEELATLRAQQRAFEELRNTELAEVQRLEEQEKRLREEKERRIKQQQLALKREREMAKKVAATTFAQQYLADLLPSVCANLRDQGYFYDPVKREIETRFLPWLMEEVNTTLENQHVARTVLDLLLQDVTNHRH